MPNLIKNPDFNPSLGATNTNQEYIFDTPTVINPQTGQTSISAQDLTPASQINLPQAPDTTTSSQQILAGTKTEAEMLSNQMSEAATQTQKEAEMRAKETNPLMDWLSASEKTQGESSADLYKSVFGEVPNLQKARQEEATQKQLYQTAKNEFNLVQNKIRALNDQASAIPLKLQEEATGRGITSGGLAPIQAGELRKVAIASLALTPELYAAQAKMADAQGNYESAKTYLSEAMTASTNYFNALLQDKKDITDYKNKVIDKVYDYATNKERQELDLLKTKNAQEFSLLQDSIAEANKIANTALENGQADIYKQIRGLDINDPNYSQKVAALGSQIKIEDPVVKNLRETYHDAGILPTDSVATAQAKIKNSRIYQKETRIEPTTNEKQSSYLNTASIRLEQSKAGGQNVDGNVYMELRRNFPGDGTEFDRNFAHLLSQGDQNKYQVGRWKESATTGKNMTASTIDPQTTADLLDDIGQNATLNELYLAYPDVSPSLIQSLYYNR